VNGKIVKGLLKLKSLLIYFWVVVWAMAQKDGFMGGFLVLGFVVFIAGFLVGMLAIMVMPVSADTTLLGLLFFVLGFVVGILAVGLIWLVFKRRKSATKA